MLNFRFDRRIMREVDPGGVEQRKHRRLHRRMYVSPGANFCWPSMNTINGSRLACVDGFSRRIICLEVQRSNKNSRLCTSQSETSTPPPPPPLFKCPPPWAKKLFKCLIKGPFQVIKCPHSRENYQNALVLRSFMQRHLVHSVHSFHYLYTYISIVANVLIYS